MMRRSEEREVELCSKLFIVTSGATRPSDGMLAENGLFINVNYTNNLIETHFIIEKSYLI